MDLPAELLSQLERFCVYQERCEQDVRKKLTATPCSVAQRDAIIEHLREFDFLNEERYVDTFVRSKLHEQWGRLKIRQALRVKNIDPKLIDERFADIDEEEYRQMLEETIAKWRRINAGDADNKNKLIRFLLNRGFQMDEVLAAVKQD